MCKRISLFVLAAIVVSSCLELGGWMPAVPGIPDFVSRAEAVVGRPLTPASVAGVARRSARRCAAGVTC